VGGEPDAVGGEVDWRRVYYGGPIRFGRILREFFRRSTTANAYLRSNVIRLDTDPVGTRVVSAQIMSAEGRAWTVSSRVFILAAGGIDNPRLLLASNRPHRAGLGNARDLVGRFFMEHPRIVDRVWLPKAARSRAQPLRRTADNLHFGRLHLSHATQRKQRLLNYSANIYLGFAGQETKAWESVRRIAIPLRRPWNESPFIQDAGGGPMRVHWSDVKAVITNPIESGKGIAGAVSRSGALVRFLNIASSIEQPPRRENRVMLGTTLDRFGVPLPVLHWRLEDAEKLTYERGLEIVMEYLDTQLRGIKEQKFERGDWSRDVKGTWHHMGTTRMHPDPAQGVVDQHCRVHELENLYIAGSCVFPTGGTTSPTLTILALAIRLADHLLAEL
jgi:choline dehydrogenase-like flavoprotein